MMPPVSQPSRTPPQRLPASCRPPAETSAIRLDELLRTVPSKTLSIDDSLTLKDGNLFFLCKTFGDVPFAEESAEGLYYHDCRFLDGYELRLADRPMESLVSTSAKGYQALIELTNPDLFRPDGDLFARSEEIGIKWTRTLDEASLSLTDEIAIRNFGSRSLALPLTLRFKASFQDIFAVRSLAGERRGTFHPVEWHRGHLHFCYDGCDGLTRQLWVHPHTEPALVETDRLVFMVSLGQREETSLCLTISLSEGPAHEEVIPGPPNGGGEAAPGSGPAPAGETAPGAGARIEPIPTLASAGVPSPARTLPARRHEREPIWTGEGCSLRTSNVVIDSIMERSFRDLRMLRSSLDGEDYYAAGVPWFATLFGRDSIVAALQTLAYDPSISRQTLLILAKYQGQVNDLWREEEPGKIMHEIRVGELAHIGEVPHSPYYGTVDATPLFLVLAARYHAWTGDNELFGELAPNIQAAASWMRAGARANGYITYESTSARGLTNQGWKDSENGIQNGDGSLAAPPIALVEVQAYAYRARLELAELYLRLGDAKQGVILRHEAAELQERFNREYWMPPARCFALALAAGGRKADVCTSNAGHALWAGIADRAKARDLRHTLMRPDMFNGWGIRTLSSESVGYNPIGYHVGTVWPHDNSMVLHGLRRYGFDREAATLFSGMVEAARNFDLYRLPELFAGFSRTEYEVPVHYPLANKPQAWAAGTVPSMMTSMLGLVPEAAAGRLRVIRPVLPEFLTWVELKGLRVGRNRVDLRFERAARGVAVRVQRKDRPLDIVVEL
jgi:glycogen debranching enzyme